MSTKKILPLALAGVLLFVAGYFLSTLIGWQSERTPDFYIKSTVVRVIDGDTVELVDGTVVRYLDIDTPETVHPTKPVECYGLKATERNRQLVENRVVYLDASSISVDAFGRRLAYVYTDESFINAELVWGGFAYSRSYGKSGNLYQLLIRLESVAREQDKGLWGECGG